MPLIKKIVLQKQGVKYELDPKTAVPTEQINNIQETLNKGKVEFVASTPSDKQPNTLYVEPFNGEVF